MMPGVELREVRRADGVRLVVAVQGSGPLVLMVPGFPESWFSWRHQMPEIAAAGFTAAALEPRGYGDSDRPEAIEAYTIVEMAADIAAVIDALDPSGAVLIGHDWGAALVQGATLLHPEKVRALVTVSVPVMPQLPAPLSVLGAEYYPDKLFYMTYFFPPGRAEAELDADPRRFLRLFYYWMSGDRPGDEDVLIRPAGSTTLLGDLTDPDPFPGWLAPDELDYYVTSFERSGFTGALNRYRATDLDFEQLAPLAAHRIAQPTMFIAGSRDPSRYMFPGHDLYADPLARCDDPRGVHIIEGPGHWIQQEAVEEFNRLLLPFLEATANVRAPTIDVSEGQGRTLVAIRAAP